MPLFKLQTESQKTDFQKTSVSLKYMLDIQVRFLNLDVQPKSRIAGWGDYDVNRLFCHI